MYQISIAKRLGALMFFLAVVLPTNCERSPSFGGRHNLRGLSLESGEPENLLQRRVHWRKTSDQEPGEQLYGWKPWPADQKLKVIYGVSSFPNSNYAEQMEAVADTWSQHVSPQRLLVVGVNGSVPGITYTPSTCKEGQIEESGDACNEAALLATGFKLNADWVVVADADTYVFTKRMEKRLAKEDASKSQILGHFGCGDGQFCEDKKGGVCGGGGYAISRAALAKMMGEGQDAGSTYVEDAVTTAATVCGNWSDMTTSCLARRRGVEQVTLDGLYGWKLCYDEDEPGTCPFHKNDYRDIMFSKHMRRTEFPRPLTFHELTPTEMRVVHSMNSDEALRDYEEYALVSWGGNASNGRKAGLLHFRGTLMSSYAAQRAAYNERMNEVMAPAAA